MALTALIIIVLIFSIIIHEYGHAWMANRLGDSTAKDLGRLTLNPIPHIDLFGSIILPFFFILSQSGFILAWAKPVPYNPNRIKDKKYGDLKVAIAGPLSNIIIATFFGLVVRLLPVAANIKQGLFLSFLSRDNDVLNSLIAGNIWHSIILLSIIFIFINLLLAFFNLIPIPPLDGSKIVLNFLPEKLKYKALSIERYGLFIVLILLMTGLFRLIIIPIIYSFSFLSGINLF
ncbi:MAG: site-2 protease family protein [Patescibacteria group bacterium]|jgi:Zn-dependent protease|nr:site-2 protease family protein [Patescibacteria group bacterium]